MKYMIWYYSQGDTANNVKEIVIEQPTSEQLHEKLKQLQQHNSIFQMKRLLPDSPIK